MSEASTEPVTSVACYRELSGGTYRTFRPGDYMFKKAWVFIHNGDCECEGKTAVDGCAEPGDTY